MKMMLRTLLMTAAMSPFISCSSAANSDGDASSRSANYDQDTTFVVNGQDVNVGNGVYVLFKTTKGDMLAELYYKAAPMTVGSFVSLANGTNKKTNVRQGQAYFDGLKFHRVIPGFVIQGGDPMGNGQGGPGYKFPQEIVDTLRHNKKGILSMANAGPNTNGSQFFITDGPTPNLNGGYNVFGEVVSGLDIISAIANTERNGESPNPAVLMETVRIYKIGGEAKAFNGYDAFIGVQEALQAEEMEMEERRTALARELSNTFNWYRDGSPNASLFSAKIQEWKDEATYTESGLGVLRLNEPNGPQVNPNEMQQIDYVGYLDNGKIFDSSLEEVAQLGGVYNPGRQYAPLPVQVARGGLIQGWLEAIPMMKKGEHARLIIPSNLGYGPNGYGNVIPGGATLIFDIYVHE